MTAVVAGRLFLPRAFQCLMVMAGLAGLPDAAYAQRARENAVTEASDAFGTTVGREQVGLYSSSSARGFNPSQAGNLRIEGLYFDQVAGLGNRISRGNSVHVGISAQGYSFPAPTGMVDFDLRTPGDAAAGGALLGYGSFDQAYLEFDGQTPIVKDVLSIGGGVGYSHNSILTWGAATDELSAGSLARWQVSESLRITPFWSYAKRYEKGARPTVTLGTSGYPTYRVIDLEEQSWADWATYSTNIGATAHMTIGRDWTLGAGLFQSRQRTGDDNGETFLTDTDSTGQGEYSVAMLPRRRNDSISGEVRVSRQIDTENIRNTLHVSVKGRDRHNEFGGTHRISLGSANLFDLPAIPEPDFMTGPTTKVDLRQITPGLAYEGVWRNVGQLSLGAQKSFYRRTSRPPGVAAVSGRNSPWLYNIGGAGYVSQRFAVYGSYTRGFEEMGNAPQSAVNSYENVPAQASQQVDAGIRYSITPALQLITGVFEIEKPYFSLDAVRLYRHVGTIRNRGAEFSLAGPITDRWTIVAGVTYIDPEVTFNTGSAATRSTAVGPVPILLRINTQYQVPWLEGLRLDARVETLSKRYADLANTIRLPAITTVDAGLRYTTTIMGRDVTARLQGSNLTDAKGLKATGSSAVDAIVGRRFEFSLAVDM